MVEAVERKAWRKLNRALAKLKDARRFELGQSSFDVILADVQVVMNEWSTANRALCESQGRMGFDARGAK